MKYSVVFEYVIFGLEIRLGHATMVGMLTRPDQPPSFQPLGQLADRLFQGLPRPRRRADGPEVRLINVGDLRDGRVAADLSTCRLPRRYDATPYLVQEADVVATCRGTQLKVAYVTPDVAGAAISSNLIGIRLGPELTPLVLFAYLRSPRGHAALLGRSRSSSLSLSLTANSIAKMGVPVPPAETQRRVADLIRAAEDGYEVAVRAAHERRAIGHAVALRLLSGAPDRSGNDTPVPEGDVPCTR